MPLAQLRTRNLFDSDADGNSYYYSSSSWTSVALLTFFVLILGLLWWLRRRWLLTNSTLNQGQTHIVQIVYATPAPNPPVPVTWSQSEHSALPPYSSSAYNNHAYPPQAYANSSKQKSFGDSPCFAPLAADRYLVSQGPSNIQTPSPQKQQQPTNNNNNYYYRF
ncbi:UNVERIFIED_CONTAM: hypothetical protein HDU68_007877 [Siphonaria sp. JEL0065]|nr:hypothetical protein HDU68_007877 [Siphonaria sp. JEL0065]